METIITDQEMTIIDIPAVPGTEKLVKVTIQDPADVGTADPVPM